eukprot:TRINITY_DN3321_c0_g1_i1.p1 TRINITY_DN3321_c0_g1~~TRINITY_DN3321_c0_g1_i1.p1  ORF type:complete len:1172 (+),score=263.44 TRINITY_DN3321_c0_g1_i1:305-3820(+)
MSGNNNYPPGYPPQNPNYPPGYPPQNPSYPPQNTGYPPQNTGYPPAGYPPQSSGYSPQNPSYPHSNMGYPNYTGQAGYSATNPFARNTPNVPPPTLPQRPASTHNSPATTPIIHHRPEVRTAPALPTRPVYDTNAPPALPQRPAEDSPALPQRGRPTLQPTTPTRPRRRSNSSSGRSKFDSVTTPGESLFASIDQGVYKPITIRSSREEYLIAHVDESKDPLVIKKNNGHPGSFSKTSTSSHFQSEYIGHCILGIVTIEGESFMIFVTEVEEVGVYMDHALFRVKETTFLSFEASGEYMYAGSGDKPPYHSVQKFCNSGLLYFSDTYHLTLTQKKQKELGERLHTEPLWKNANENFWWNKYLQRHFMRANVNDYLTVVIRGFVEIHSNQYLPSREAKIDIGLISRISCSRTGTRYSARGIDDDGHVANFVETEQLLFVPEKNRCFSFLQIRGSVPVFWEQRMAQKKATPKPALTRTAESTTPAFKKHFDELLTNYESIHIVNLLSQKKKEKVISDAYQDQLTRYDNVRRLQYTLFDFHYVCGNKHFEKVNRIFDKVSPPLRPSLESYGYTSYDVGSNLDEIQDGTIRTNCLDCLDRTNVVQGSFAKESLKYQLKSMGYKNTISDYDAFGRLFKNLWADNGDSISRSYAGTGAMKSSYTRSGKRSFGGMLDDVGKSLNRMYINKFKDGSKAMAIDIFLGNIEEEIDDQDLPVELRWMNKQLNFHKKKYTSSEDIKVFVGTWNVNGQIATNSDMDPWISPLYDGGKIVNHDEVSLYVIGFQEIVELNKENIRKADKAHTRSWERLLSSKINEKRHPDNPIVLARSEQLVGIAISIFVSRSEAQYLGNVGIEKVKVGARGLTGNKGGICTRFDYKDSSFCCISAHLSAGHSKCDDRISDYHTIMKTKFKQFGKIKIEDHDYVFWFGDFNMRINESKPVVLRHIRTANWDYLREFDQLLINKNQGRVWSGFKEGKINFPPSYKFDTGTDVYDTSDKQRIPAWTDRILYRSIASKIKQEFYLSGEMYISDHRPVMSLFTVEALTVNEEEKQRLEEYLYKQANENEEIISNLGDIQFIESPWDFDGTLAQLMMEEAQETRPKNQAQLEIEGYLETLTRVLEEITIASNIDLYMPLVNLVSICLGRVIHFIHSLHIARKDEIVSTITESSARMGIYNS